MSGRYLPCRAPGSLPAERFNLSYRSSGSPTSDTDMSRRLCAVSINSGAGATIRAIGGVGDIRFDADLMVRMLSWVAVQTVVAGRASSWSWWEEPRVAVFERLPAVPEGGGDGSDRQPLIWQSSFLSVPSDPSVLQKNDRRSTI